MVDIHKLTAAHAREQLTEAVKVAQGSKKTASWKPSARPCWWIDDHAVTLLDNSEVRTGIFDGNAKRKWKKSHYQAALFLYEQWRADGKGKQEDKKEPEAKEEIKEEIKEEPSLPMTRKTRGKKEESVMQLSIPQPKPRRGKGKRLAVGEVIDVDQPVTGENSAEDKETQRPLRTRTRRILRAKKEMVTPHQPSRIPTRRTSSRRSSSSSEQTDASPTPVIRRTRAKGRGKQVVTSPKLQSSLLEPPSRKPQRRTGKAVTPQARKTQTRRELIPQSPESHLSPPPHHQSSGASTHEEDGVTPARISNEEAEIGNRRSPRLSASSTASSPSSTSPKMRKRSLSEVEDESVSRPLRGPLQELQDKSNTQDNHSKKRRRVTDLEETSSGKENQAPGADISKSARIRSTRERTDKTITVEVDDIETEATTNNDESQGQKAVYDTAQQGKKEKRIKFLREQMKCADAERDHMLKLIEDNFEEYETEINMHKRQYVEKLRAAYRTKKLKFSRQILDMPISTFAQEHGGSVDEWMLHDTKEGVNKTFEALNKGEAPKIGMMGPPKTPTAMSRRAALATTARKTRRKVVEDAPATGFTIRRSQRTAAKVATERTRAIISCTPRTGRKEAPAPAPPNPQPPQTPTGNASGYPVSTPNFANICSRQQMAVLSQSIQRHDNPVEAFRQFTAQLKRETFQ